MKVGVFDSGVGGLLTARILRSLHPQVDLLYYGDTAHLPYGDKSPWQIKGYVQEIARFLQGVGAQALVVACNTASAVALESLRAEFAHLPLYDAITPALEAFAKGRYPEPVGIIGTYTTIRSGVYGTALRQMGYAVKELATPLLVPLIEEGWLDHPAMEATLDTYLAQLGEVGTLLLACTHYPVLEGAITRYYRRVGASVQVLSTAALLARKVAQELPLSGQRTQQFWVSDWSERFTWVASTFWGEPITLEPAPLTSAWSGW